MKKTYGGGGGHHRLKPTTDQPAWNRGHAADGAPRSVTAPPLKRDAVLANPAMHGTKGVGSADDLGSEGDDSVNEANEKALSADGSKS